MRVIVVGYGVQGVKRARVAGDSCVAIVDPVHESANFKQVEDVDLAEFDAALVCTPDSAKFEVLSYLLSNKKHVLVEKPLLSASNKELEVLRDLASVNQVTLYTAYNHRFEPHFVRMKELIDSGKLGNIYSIRMFYGNGTARLVRESEWRDQGGGVIPDLGSHLLDTLHYWFGQPQSSANLIEANCWENKAPDHCVFGFQSDSGKGNALSMQLEMTLLSWRNHFYADVYAEKGSAHIQSLCKWGPSTFTHRVRELPSGRPDEEQVTLVQSDPTWDAEWLHFLGLCKAGISNIENDIWINSELNSLMRQAGISDSSESEASAISVELV